jgi:hypothetical protein
MDHSLAWDPDVQPSHVRTGIHCGRLVPALVVSIPYLGGVRNGCGYPRRLENQFYFDHLL